MVDLKKAPRIHLLPALAGALLLLTPLAGADSDEAAVDLSHYYGFGELEIAKLEWRSRSMLPGDLNSDGLTDLVLADNSHSRLDLLLQRKEQPDEQTLAAQAASVNEITSGWRFEHRKLPVNEQIASVALGDFNGDGRTDIAYFGVPDRLVVRFQPESGEWVERTSFRLPDVLDAQWIMAAGDLNGDKRDDLVVVGTKVTYVLYQGEDQKLARPVRLMNTADKLSLVQIADLDGDGREDLCYVANDDLERSFCARLQTAAGELGPELRFELRQPRGISLADIDGRPGKEVLCIDANTGRAKVLKVKRPAAEAGELAGQLVQYGFGAGSGRDRDMATGDLDGDGLTDVVVTDPESAQVIVFRQQEGQGLDLGTPFPGFIGSSQVRVASFGDDKACEVVVLSPREKTIGISRFEENRLTFPQALPVEGEPAALELVDLDGDGSPEVVYLAREGGRRDAKYEIRALRRTGAGDWEVHKFGESTGVSVELAGTPDRLVRLDANRDGRPDFLVFYGLDRTPELFTTNESGVPQKVSAGGGIRIGDVSAGAVFVGGEKQDAVLVAQNNFARSLQLGESGEWRVLDQYNAAESNARIAGAVLLDLDGESGDEVVLVDTGIRRLRVLRREENLYRPWREVEMGTFDYQAAHVADLNSDGRDDLLLLGGGKFAVLYSGRTDPTLEEIASYESKLKDVFFGDLVAGDLNHDGGADVVLIDTKSHYVEVVTYDAEHGLRPALHFKIFEEKSFSGRGEGGSEPRETVVADVTGDGRADLILLAHDRVLLYPQDDGERAAESDAKQ